MLVLTVKQVLDDRAEAGVGVDPGVGGLATPFRCGASSTVAGRRVRVRQP